MVRPYKAHFMAYERLFRDAALLESDDSWGLVRRRQEVVCTTSAVYCFTCHEFHYYPRQIELEYNVPSQSAEIAIWQKCCEDYEEWATQMRTQIGQVEAKYVTFSIRLTPGTEIFREGCFLLFYVKATMSLTLLTPFCETEQKMLERLAEERTFNLLGFANSIGKEYLDVLVTAIRLVMMGVARQQEGNQADIKRSEIEILSK